MNVVISPTDALVVLQLIERVSEKGLLKGLELEPVGKLFVSVDTQVTAIRQALEQQRQAREQAQVLPVVEEEKKE